ncbi:MAG TPA: phosphate acyltransferase PlsX [Candidatus Hydrogenedentes bacterium]|nr:phosphate acyltransferase PlsX [Candidatus Hydrogenedentota bacterium]HOS03077.1 phosphate acyltransferase PlsX [Candidatus Hydrogenedentota bacterium]
MRIAVDAMGSDKAPGPEVRGAVDASLAGDVEILLVGDETMLQSALEIYPKRGKISIVHASQVIAMHDSPIQAVRQKKDASILVGLRLVKHGEAAGFVSAGNTGAVMMAARTILGPIRGVARSPICQQLPTKNGKVLLVDLGANVDCSARHLCDFAEMGAIYSKFVLDVANPRVGLLNIGEEQLKGNDVTKTVHRNLSAATNINFIGNIEPRAMFEGQADVVVCDGFVGNMVLKTTEAAGGLVSHIIKREFRRTWISMLGGLFAYGAFKRIRHDVDPNEYFGAPLLGVNGAVIILHGSAMARGVANAIRGARLAVEANINERIRCGAEELRNAEAALNAAESKP